MASAELLETARREASLHNIAIETVLAGGSVVGSLMEAVRMHHIDLLVLGIHPDHELPEWLSSSMAHELAKGVPCNVLGVH